jgi:type II secretion system protein N
VSGRRLAVAAGVAVLFVAALLALLPADSILRSVLARAIPPGGPTVTFRHAALWPWGIEVEQPVLQRPDGATLMALDSLRLRPSLWGLVRDRTGRPWSVNAAACGGAASAVIGSERGTTTVVLEWHDVDLAHCAPLAVTGSALAGRAEGRASLAIAPATAPTGAGAIEVHGAAWRAESGPLAAFDTLHADTAMVRWTFEGGRLTMDAIDLHGPELEASGSGAVRMASVLGHSAVDVRMAVITGPAAAPLLRGLVGTLPASTGDPAGPRDLIVTGTLDRPEVVRQ